MCQMNIPYIFCFLLTSVTVLKSQREHMDMLESREKNIDTDSSSNENKKIKFQKKEFLKVFEIDMTGYLRKYFALEAALLDDQSNMVCSPVAALLPLGKLAYGHRGATRVELLRAAGVERKSLIGSSFRRLLRNLQYLPGVQLNIATRIYVPYDLTISEKFKDKCQKTFNSDVKRIDYSDRTGASRKINQWVSEQTRGKISNVITPDQLDRDTSMVIVNAIYFMGEWDKPFNKAVIKDFTTPFGVKRIPMMTRNGMYEYMKSDTFHAQVVEIPFKGSAVSMIIILPYSEIAIPRLLKYLKSTPSALNSAIHRMQTRKVEVSIPKFKMVQNLDLNTMYEKVGIRRIFNPERSKMSKKKDMWVSEAVQVAFLDVNESGSSVSGKRHIEELKKEPRQLIFNANRPFLFFIQGDREQLFAGLYYGVGIK